jgi:hypothetical protein
MHLIADAAATLGSRFNLIFDAHDHCVYQNAFGDFRERPLDLAVGVRTPDGRVWALPFTTRAGHFPFVEQLDTLTSIEYRAVHPGLVGPVLDLLTFYVDLWITAKLPLARRGDHFALPGRGSNSWADGRTLIIGEDDDDVGFALSRRQSEAAAEQKQAGQSREFHMSSISL